ncbi:SdpI family protein [Lactobacillus xylocopicola]|uniref:Hemolysin expression modulating protein n=1 Tax=Lactobacillus xylocopicola TaxID=2976676 RepID=A0ABM8BHT9_9LACO|nr:SdpI family protein [Lactobacillus xylocopicola]BDR60866.1 hemolysin expression modulating protein [Lactobacillus xylocopicola]
MKKNNYRKTVVVTSLLTVLPLLVGLLLYQRLPAKMATHFGLNNVPNGFSNKFLVVVGMPLLLLLLQLIVLFVWTHEAKGQDFNFKLVEITLWLVPVMSNVLGFTLYLVALGQRLRMSVIANLLFGLLLLIFGNYLPKTRPNRVVGIRLPWTLASSTNWQKTHRLTGWLFMVGGLVLLCTSFLPNNWLFVIILLVVIIVPIVYAYSLSRAGR